MLFDNFFSVVLINLSSLYFLVSFLAPILAGENGVLITGFLSAKGHFPLWGAIFFSFLGMITIDSFWFLMTKTKWANKIKIFGRKYKKYVDLEKKIEKISHKNDVLILMISKLMLGTRILILIYLSMRNMSFKKFFSFNLFPTFIWAIILCHLGWFAGKGYYAIESVSKGLVATSIYILTLILLLYILISLIRKWIIKDTI